MARRFLRIVAGAALVPIVFFIVHALTSNLLRDSFGLLCSEEFISGGRAYLVGDPDMYCHLAAVPRWFAYMAPLVTAFALITFLLRADCLDSLLIGFLGLIACLLSFTLLHTPTIHTLRALGPIILKYSPAFLLGSYLGHWIFRRMRPVEFKANKRTGTDDAKAAT